MLETFREMEKHNAFTAEEGSRHVVYAAVALQDREEELRGAYTSVSEIREVSDDVLSAEGQKAQVAVWVRPFPHSEAMVLTACLTG
jgi:hypothetical protein